MNSFFCKKIVEVKFSAILQKKVMKTINLYLLLIPILWFASVKCLAQATVYHPFPKDSAMWSATVYDDNNGVLSNPISTIYKLKGDSVINGIKYTKIFRGNPFDYVDDTKFFPFGFLKEDSATRKVYIKYDLNFFGDSSDILLYDFNAAIGDSISIKVLNHTKTSFISEKSVVVSIDSIPTNAGFRKAIRLRFMRNFMETGTDTLYMAWVEGVGSLINPIYNELCDNCYSGKLVMLSCFSVGGNLLITNPFGPCYTAPQSIGKIDAPKITIYPNPVRSLDDVEIISSAPIMNIMLYNLLGQLVFTKPYPEQNAITLHTGIGNKGMYNYIIEHKERGFTTGKILIY